MAKGVQSSLCGNDRGACVAALRARPHLPQMRHGCLLLLALLATSRTFAEAPEAAPDDPEGWEASISAGAIVLTGNSRSITANAEALVDYRSEAWELHAELGAIVGWAADAGEDAPDPAAEWLLGHVRGERRFGSRLTAFLLLGGEVNHPASLEGRAEAEAGVGITLLETFDPELRERLFLRLYLGAHLAKDYRFQFFPIRRDLEDLLMVGPGAGLSFRWALNERVALSERVRAYPNVVGDARVLAYSDTRLTVDLTSRLALDLHLLLELDTQPAPEKQALDLAFTTGLKLQL